MKSPHQIERQRGIKEAGEQLGALRERWPLAFPVQHQDIRPWHWASPTRSPREWAGRFPTRSACFAAGKWQRSTARPYFPTTNASRLMARQPRRSTRGRRTWRPSSWRGSPPGTPLRRPRHPPWRSRSRQPIGCVQRRCAGTRRATPKSRPRPPPQWRGALLSTGPHLAQTRPLFDGANPPREVPRLCRGGSKSLTFTAVVYQRSSRRGANRHTEGNFWWTNKEAGHKGGITRRCCRSII
jgi:hypothetical protein